MTNATQSLTNAKRRLCRTVDNRFDRRYRSLETWQQYLTMFVSVGSVALFFDPLTGAGLGGSLVALLLPFVLFALSTTLFWRFDGD
jgi:hypothetical protein